MKNGRAIVWPSLGRVCIVNMENTTRRSQVLVSIQAFIFVKHPYFNEPGYTLCQGQAEHDRRSEEYSERVRRDTARAAMKIPPVFQPFFSAKKGSS